MKTALAVTALVVLGLSRDAALAQEQSNPLPLSGFVRTFTDLRATSAQKELLLPEGAWYEGAITVSDVEYHKPEGKDAAWAEIKDWNYVGGCTMLLFKTAETEGALKLGVGDQAVVRARFSGTSAHEGLFPTNCRMRVGIFTDTQILTVQKPTN